MKYILKTKEQQRFGFLISLGIAISFLFLQIYSLFAFNIHLFWISTLIYLGLIIITMIFLIVDNKVITSIRKNAVFIDCFSIGHFLMGYIVFIILQGLVQAEYIFPNFEYSLICLGIFAGISFLASFVYEMFEFIFYFRSKSIKTTLSDFWFNYFEDENQTKAFIYQKDIHNENLINLFISDNYFFILGTLFGFCIQQDLAINVAILVCIGYLYFFHCRRSLVKNFKEGLVLIEKD